MVSQKMIKSEKLPTETQSYDLNIVDPGIIKNAYPIMSENIPTKTRSYGVKYQNDSALKTKSDACANICSESGIAKNKNEMKSWEMFYDTVSSKLISSGSCVVEEPNVTYTEKQCKSEPCEYSANDFSIAEINKKIKSEENSYISYQSTHNERKSEGIPYKGVPSGYNSSDSRIVEILNVAYSDSVLNTSDPCEHLASEFTIAAMQDEIKSEDVCCKAEPYDNSISKTQELSHTEEKHHKCDLCDYSTTISRHLKKHTETHSGKRKKHTETHSGKKKKQSKTHSGKRKKHTETHSGKKKKHTETHSGKKKKHTETHSGKRQKHTETHSGKTNKHTETHSGKRKKHTETHSGKRKKHTETHSGKKNYKCDLCGYSSKLFGSLETHKLIHSGECDLCDYSATTSAALKTHQRIHRGEKLHTCDVCHYSTTQSGSFKIHKLKHTAERPYKCKQCEFSTAQSCNLKRHIKRVHSTDGIGHKVHKCGACDYKTTNVGHMRNHKMMHSGEKPYSCTVLQS